MSGRALIPFDSVVGLDGCRTAIECALVNPGISTVLLRGPPGTGKSLLAASVGSITDRRMVFCPCTADRSGLFGDVDIGATAASGKYVFTEGVLDRADGAVLVIDDINLMEPNLALEVLECVRRGFFHGRGGTRPCRTTLIATMDPGERELSPHMLDRFDLAAYAEPSEQDRAAVLKGTGRREGDAAESVRRACKALPLITVPDGISEVVQDLCTLVSADGSRADIQMINCSLALAALRGRDTVMKADVEEAATLCLPHRRNERYVPPRKKEAPEPRSGPEDVPDGGGEEGRPSRGKGTPVPAPEPEETVFEIGREFKVIDYLGDPGRVPPRVRTKYGRRRKTEQDGGSGRYVRPRVPRGSPRDIAFDATIRAAAPYQRDREGSGLAVKIEESDIREKVRERRSGCTLMFLVDASGSLGARRRMATVKGAVLSMLRDSYVKRDRIGLAAFRRDGMEVILPPTRSVEYAYRCLSELPTGGKTPLGAALISVTEYMSAYRRSHPGEICYVVLITDGRANVPVYGGDANREAKSIAESISEPGLGWIVIDAGTGFADYGDARDLSESLCARYFKLENMDAEMFAAGVRLVTSGGRRRPCSADALSPLLIPVPARFSLGSQRLPSWFRK